MRYNYKSMLPHRARHQVISIISCEKNEGTPALPQLSQLDLRTDRYSAVTRIAEANFVACRKHIPQEMFEDAKPRHTDVTGPGRLGWGISIWQLDDYRFKDNTCAEYLTWFSSKLMNPKGEKLEHEEPLCRLP